MPFFGRVVISVLGGCKVAWESLCVPKEEGGLGIKDMGLWNKATMV